MIFCFCLLLAGVIKLNLSKIIFISQTQPGGPGGPGSPGFPFLPLLPDFPFCPLDPFLPTVQYHIQL